MDAFRPEGSGGRRDHPLDQRIGPFLLGDQDVVGIAVCVVGRPLENLFKVRQRLDAGDHLDAERVGVVVEVLELFPRVAPAQIAEERLAGHLVGVLGVEHHHVESHQRAAPHQRLRALRPQHAVARAVHHDPQDVEPRGLGEIVSVGLRFAQQPAQRAKRVAPASVAHPNRARVLGDRKPRASERRVALEAHRDGLTTRGKPLRSLRHDLGQALAQLGRATIQVNVQLSHRRSPLSSRTAAG